MGQDLQLLILKQLLHHHHYLVFLPNLVAEARVESHDAAAGFNGTSTSKACKARVEPILFSIDLPQSPASGAEGDKPPDKADASAHQVD